MLLRSLLAIVTLKLTIALITGVALASTIEKLPEDGLPAESILRVAEHLRTRLETTSGHPVRCVGLPLDCIEGYDQLLAFDWSRSPTERRKALVLSPRHASRVESDRIIINTREPKARLLKIFAGATDFSQMGHPLATELLRKSAQGELPDQTPRSCAERADYYRDLFRDGRLDMTIVRGYHDAHTESFGGYLLEQFFKFRKVPVEIGFNQKLIDELLAALRQEGFRLTNVGTGEWHLERPFRFEGRTLTAAVHLYSATVLCDGEVPDAKGLVHRYDDEACPRQLEATRRAREAFRNAFGQSQIILYDGHSRHGRGPDFGPMSLDDGKFPIRKGALRDLDLRGLKTLLFLTSCDSLEYFQEAIEKKQRSLRDPGDLVFFANTASSLWANGAQETVSLLKSIMEARCPADVVAELNLPKPAGGLYAVVPTPLSNWLAPEAIPLQPAAPRYKAALGPDRLPRCYEAEGDLEHPVDDRLCAFSYDSGLTSDARLYCYAKDQSGMLYGSPVDARLCNSVGTIQPSPLPEELSRAGHVIAFDPKDQQPRCFATENLSRPERVPADSSYCAYGRVLRSGADGVTRCYFSDASGFPYGDPLSLEFCLR